MLPLHSYFEPLALASSRATVQLRNEVPQLSSQSLAESHTAASANADAAHCLLSPYVIEHYHIDELTVVVNLKPHLSLKNTYSYRLLGLLFKSSKLPALT